jgi:hypothetical protein
MLPLRNAAVNPLKPIGYQLTRTCIMLVVKGNFGTDLAEFVFGS